MKKISYNYRRSLRKQEDLRLSGIVQYVFDLSRPIGTQIEKVKKDLPQEQEHHFGMENTRSPQKENWPLHLRALDAKDSGASYSEMAEAFWPDLWHVGEKTAPSARDTYFAAVRVQDNFPI